MPPIFFPHKNDLRKWFLGHYLTEKELWLGYHKVGTGKPSISWPESVDVALCFGWIDGIRKSVDEHSYMIRFTKRKHTSIWSAINIAKMEELIKQNLVMPEGLAAFNNRKDHKSKIYSYENEDKILPSSFENQFKANKKAWDYFTSLAHSYQKTAIYWVISAKQERTRLLRLETLINDSEDGRKIAPLSYGKKK